MLLLGGCVLKNIRFLSSEEALTSVANTPQAKKANVRKTCFLQRSITLYSAVTIITQELNVSAQTTKQGSQNQYPSSSHSHPGLPQPGPPPSSQEGRLRTHCIWGSGTPSWSHPYIRVRCGAAQLRAKEESSRISTDTWESPLSRPPATSN